MIKFLFFDFRELEKVDGFERKLHRPVKYSANPLFIADEAWENGNMQLYGSVVKPPGKPFQLWYSVVHKPWRIYMAYAESDDGLQWRKPRLDIFEYEGQKTNIVLANDPHGPAVIYDEMEERDDRRYKLVAGAEPSHCICAFHSGDGIHWTPVRRFPVIGTNPDCPMGFVRTPNGRYAVYHRLHGLGRRVCRSESYDFVYWTSEPRMVLEPGPEDPTQIQFYGLGATTYGSYEIGTLWIYHTDPDFYGPHKMNGYQEAEFTYARSGYAWHRAMPCKPFIPHGSAGEWDEGNLQCASAPVFLEDEIRYYFMGTDMRHKRHWELDPQRAGLGMASIRPDRFISLAAAGEPAELVTVAFRLQSDRVFVNASTGRDGWVRLEVLDIEAKPQKGLTGDDCILITGDSTTHEAKWRNDTALASLVGESVRFRLTANNAELYSIYILDDPDEPLVYHRFSAVRP